MTSQEYKARLEKIYLNCINISCNKQGDYCSEVDQFMNFRSASICGMTIEQSIFGRLADKFSRLGTLIDKMNCGKEFTVKDETVQDTLDDLIAYGALLKVFLEEKKNTEKLFNSSHSYIDKDIELKPEKSYDNK